MKVICVCGEIHDINDDICNKHLEELSIKLYAQMKELKQFKKLLYENIKGVNMKIIGIDNLDRETVSDFLVCENIHNYSLGECMVDALNATFKGTGDIFFKLVQDEYNLYEWKE